MDVQFGTTIIAAFEGRRHRNSRGRADTFGVGDCDSADKRDDGGADDWYESAAAPLKQARK